MSIIDASSGYRNLKLDEKSLYLTTFACPFGQCQYKQLPFGAVHHWVTCSNAKLMRYSLICLNVFGITDDSLVIGYNNNGADDDAVVHKVLQRCEEVNLKLNKDKCHFRCTCYSFLWER